MAKRNHDRAARDIADPHPDGAGGGDLAAPSQTGGTGRRSDPDSRGFAVFSFSAPLDDYTFSTLNRTGRKLLGVTAERIGRRPLKELLAPALHRRICDTLVLVTERRISAPFSFPESDTARSEGMLEGMFFPISKTSAAGFFSTATEPTELEKIIVRGKREWERTVDALDDIITILDPDLTIIRANRAAHSIIGRRFGELVGKKCYEIFHDRSESCPFCPVPLTALDGEPRHGVVSNQSLEKTFDISSSPIFNEDGSLAMIVHIARDVTDSIQQEEERRRLSTAIEQASEAVVITDTAGVINYVNPAFTRLTGYSRDEAMDRNMSLLNSGKHDRRVYQQLWQTILAGDIWSGELINRRKDGELYTEHCTISPIVEGDDSISSFVAVKRDITREESLERQLQQAIKLEAIGTLAGGIAHDFNNILSAILGYAQIAKGQLDDRNPALYSLDQIIAAGDRAVDLIKQILTFSRREEHREPFKPLKVQFIVKEALRLLRSSTPATIRLNQNIDSTCSAIMADASQIHQVIMNLCTNALQAIGDRYGEISVSLEETEVDTPLRLPSHGTLKSGRYLHLQVSDSGCGMDERVQQRIFDPFFTTKPKDHGTGLGLSVVHGIVTKHQGHISITSAVNEGTTFDLYFPVFGAPVVVPERQEGRIRGGTEHLLVIDDELQIIDFLKVALERLGYRVTPFTDPIEAVRYFRKNSRAFDLVITDMTMPDMTGAELAREMLSLQPRLPIVMVTGYNENIDREKALRLGIRGFFDKPLNKNELARFIRKTLDNG